MPLSTAQISDFHRDGYLFVRGLLDAEEADLLQQAAHGDALLTAKAMDVKDTQGRRTNLTLWNHPGNDLYGIIARCQKVVGAMEELLGDEVYHYHSKLSAKEPKVGGAWEWHQDYGYWYNNGCIAPDMASIFLAIDACTRENGCLQVLRGSHHFGRFDHGRFGEQTGADPERVAVAQERCELIYCIMEPGDALFFHSNLLHASAPNLSENPRWGLLCCYNTKHNNPYKDSHHPRYTKLEKVPDSSIKTMGLKRAETTQRFLMQEEDRTTGGRKEGRKRRSVEQLSQLFLPQSGSSTHTLLCKSRLSRRTVGTTVLQSQGTCNLAADFL